MFTVECHVGRLLETRVASPMLTLPSLEQTWWSAWRMVQSRPGLLVACADLRAVKVFPPEVADRLVEILRVLNPHLERSGVLVAPGNATAFLQNDRMVRRTGHEQRRIFRDVDEICAWLGEVLTGAEQYRLREFITAGTPG